MLVSSVPVSARAADPASVTPPPASSPASTPASATDLDVPPAPAAPRDDSVVDQLHGRAVHDPFRPLEQIDAPATIAWWKAHNERTNTVLSRAQQVRDVTTAWQTNIRNYTRESMPEQHGATEFFTRQSGTQLQPTWLVRAAGSTDEPRTLLDPAAMSNDGTVSIASMNPSPDGKLVAYTTSTAGSDWQTMRFRDVATGVDVGEELTGLRFTDATWTADGTGVYYNKPLARDASVDGKAFGAYLHRLGTPASSDQLVLSRPSQANSFVGAYRLSDDDPYTFFSSRSGTNPESGLFVQRPGESAPTQLFAEGVAALSPVHRVGETLYAITNLDAPRSRLVAIDMQHPEPRHWKTIVAESPDAGTSLDDVRPLGGQLLTQWSRGGAAALELRALGGAVTHAVDVPVASTVTLASSQPEDGSVQVSIGGFLSPGTRYRLAADTGALEFVKNSDIPHDLVGKATVERRYATSADGTRVPMWVIAPTGMRTDGSTPTVVYSYGGFNVPMNPGFSMEMAQWVEQGGAYVVANLRGGGEFGSQWYDDGRLANKQHTFDDLAAVSRQLTADGIATPSHIAIRGGSNGGLTVAATSQQHPELFGAVISEVPVTDLVRFPHDNYGASWMSDYGDPAKAADFTTAMAYSPLHNVDPDSARHYPPTLIMTGDHDDRVGPWHAFKWAATRIAAGQADNTLLRVTEGAGHGAGKPTRKVIEEVADRFAFLAQTIGLPEARP